ncbi:hypothetical protein BATDEDRAFT_22112 [Batrachochytrium dendrobatidis JAM81]|uniref:Palmitoyltransferase n=1 Tax=Batrachochytrium dendrobatidis (strain JAM81 / FGSC 10211) TaxID=684364 RepID=F4NSF3_BATDJ|nr:uncharacterized protein BATDEDRAFT_22112 [Batrachochytrium dendrobatidis JAM81]EGF83423.1 hypothetical protein BATDEDRAFT_22112 [Batrachochytrium dendrobatidis JAM81]|eukprot:XP_006675471.1 hypothetical protein BATDEDRAFT_22112 [Batrachochytrium dendrobatidis JAM81]
MSEFLVKKLGWLFVAFTTALITFVPVTTYVFIFERWFAYHQERNIFVWLAPFYISVLFIYINYYLGCSTDPGRVLRDYDPTNGLNAKTCSTGEEQVKPKSTVKTRKQTSKGHDGVDLVYVSNLLEVITALTATGAFYEWIITFQDLSASSNILFGWFIGKCSGPWLNNCIGHNNIPHFIRFLCSVTMASLSCLVLLGLRVWDLIKYQNSLSKLYSTGGSFRSNVVVFYTPPADDKEIIFMLVNLVILFALLFSVGILSIWQLFYVAYNVTTIESMENGKIDELMRRGKIPNTYVYPYTLSVFRNFQAVFGQRWYLWWMPASAPGNGLVFPVNENGTLGLWPPREYYLYRKYPYGKPSMEERRANKAARREAKVFMASGKKHVRRDSEGYIVKNIVAEDREEQLRQANLAFAQAAEGTGGSTEQEAEIVHLDETDESSTEFDSFEDDFDDNIDMDGIPRILGSKDDLDSPEGAHDIDSDNEILAVRQKRQQGFKKVQ